MDLSTQADKKGEAHITKAVIEDAPKMSQEEEIQRLQQELSNAEQALSNFTHALTQDLRGFLRTISVNLHEVMTNPDNHLSTSGKDELGKVAGTVKRMGLMIDGLFQMATLTKPTPKLERLNLSDLLRHIELDVKHRHVGAVKLEVEEGVTGLGDERLTTAAIERLLDNAYRYALSAAEPTVKFGCSEMNDRKAYFIQDNGPGFPPHQAHRIFEPVERLTSGQGAGVGLTTVKRLIERMGGKVWASSQPGKGATFFFTLAPGDDD
jgi:signal transduction histidine kinase